MRVREREREREREEMESGVGSCCRQIESKKVI